MSLCLESKEDRYGLIVVDKRIDGGMVMVSYKIKEILDLIKCPVICIVNREEREYVTGDKAYADMLKRDVVQGKNLEYKILGITTEEDKVVISLEKKLSDPVSADMNAAWIKEHKEKYGVEPNLFDGM